MTASPQDASSPQLDLEDFDLLVEARRQWQQAPTDDTLALFEKAMAQRPDSIRALCESARVLGMRFHVARAEACLQRATELGRGNGRVGVAIAQSYRVIHRPQRAIETYEAMLAAGQTIGPAALAELAELYEEVNRVDDALAAIRGSIERAPNQPEPKLILARLLRRRGQEGEAEALLSGLTALQQIHPLTLAGAWAELCYLRDAQGDYDGAVAAIEQNKSIFKRMPEAERLSKTGIGNNQRLAQVYNQLDQATINEWRSLDLPADVRCPQVAHLIGFPRSGTTLLEQVLDAHPGLMDAPELAVFTQGVLPAMYQSHAGGALELDAFRSLSAEQLEALRKRCIDLMEAMQGPIAGRVLLDKNPNHTSLAFALCRLFPESRFVFALRDPRDVIVSCYLRQFRLTEFSACFLTWGSTCFMYGFDMQVWQHFRRLIEGQWLQVRYEDVVADLEAQARRALDFLGLPWDANVLGYRERSATKRVHSPSHDTVRQPVYRKAIGRWRNYEKYLAPYMDRLKPFINALGYD